MRKRLPRRRTRDGSQRNFHVKNAGSWWPHTGKGGMTWATASPQSMVHQFQRVKPERSWFCHKRRITLPRKRISEVKMGSHRNQRLIHFPLISIRKLYCAPFWRPRLQTKSLSIISPKLELRNVGALDSCAHGLILCLALSDSVQG